MYQFIGSDPAEATEADLVRFSLEDHFQRHTVIDDVNSSLNFSLFINSGGIEEFKFVGDLEIRFKYYFINNDDPHAPVIEKRNNVRKFKIISQVASPFDLSFDYQLVNPLIRHLNYESNCVKKVLVLNEKSLVTMAIDNKHQAIQIQSVAVDSESQAESLKILRPMKQDSNS